MPCDESGSVLATINEFLGVEVIHLIPNGVKRFVDRHLTKKDVSLFWVMMGDNYTFERLSQNRKYILDYSLLTLKRQFVYC
jgi:hypothetical protein